MTVELLRANYGQHSIHVDTMSTMNVLSNHTLDKTLYGTNIRINLERNIGIFLPGGKLDQLDNPKF